MKIYAIHVNYTDSTNALINEFASDVLYTTRELAQAAADKENARLERFRDQAHQRNVDDWEQRRKEHDTLHEAGLRDGPFKMPDAIPRPLHEHYTVEEYDLVSEQVKS